MGAVLRTHCAQHVTSHPSQFLPRSQNLGPAPATGLPALTCCLCTPTPGDLQLRFHVPQLPSDTETEDGGACFPHKPSVLSVFAAACLAPSGSSLATQEILPVSETVLLSAASMPLLGQSLVATGRGGTPGASAGVGTRASATPQGGFLVQANMQTHEATMGHAWPWTHFGGPRTETQPATRAVLDTSPPQEGSGGLLEAFRFAQVTAQETGHEAVLG